MSIGRKILLKLIQIESQMSSMFIFLFTRVVELGRILFWIYWLLINKLKIPLLLMYSIFVVLHLKTWKLLDANHLMDTKDMLGNVFVKRWTLILLFGSFLVWQIMISKSNAIWTGSRIGRKLNREIFFRRDPELLARRIRKKSL